MTNNANKAGQEKDELIELLRQKSESSKGRLTLDGLNLEPQLQDKFQAFITQLERSVEEFGSKLFILVIFGSLKSGKSTLVNCLVGHDICPTAVGISSTKRPSLMLAGDGSTGTAEHYLPAARKAASQLGDFMKVMDHFRIKQPFGAGITREDLDFKGVTEDLRRELGPNDREPLLTVVRLPKENFKLSDVAIVDSPGLDDQAADGAKNHRGTALEWILDNADLCILVHSSLAAPNKSMHEFLARVIQGTSAPPLMILQNRFEARLWRKKNVIEEEYEAQQANTHALVISSLGDQNHLVVEKLQANLGLAANKLFKHEEIDKVRLEGLCLEDGLDAVLITIAQLLEKHREPIQCRQTVLRLKDRLQKIGDGKDGLVQACREQADRIENQHKAEQADLDELETMLKAPVLSDSNWFEPIGDAVRNERTQWDKACMELVEEVREKIRADYVEGTWLGPVLAHVGMTKGAIRGSEINSRVQAVVAELASRMGKEEFGLSFEAKLVQAMGAELRRRNKAERQDADKLLKRLNLFPYHAPPLDETSRIPEITPPQSTITDLEDGVFWPRYTTVEAQNHMREVGQQLSKNLVSQLKDYQEELKQHAFKEANRERGDLLKHVVDQRKEHQDAYVNGEQPRVAACRKCADDLQNDIVEITRKADVVLKILPRIGRQSGGSQNAVVIPC